MFLYQFVNVCLVLIINQTWIDEKKKLLEATEDLGDDLVGIMTLQRRLSGMERDLAAIHAKVIFFSALILYSFIYLY